MNGSDVRRRERPGSGAWPLVIRIHLGHRWCLESNPRTAGSVRRTTVIGRRSPVGARVARAGGDKAELMRGPPPIPRM
jgi:hypothetical protein